MKSSAINSKLAQDVKDLYEDLLLNICSKISDGYELPEIIMAQQGLLISLLNMIPNDACKKVYWETNGNDFIEYLKEMSKEPK